MLIRPAVLAFVLIAFSVAESVFAADSPPAAAPMPKVPDGFSIELAATTPVPEWGGKELWVGAEEDAAIDEAGRASWVLKRQTEYHLVK